MIQIVLSVKSKATMRKRTEKKEFCRGLGEIMWDKA